MAFIFGIDEPIDKTAVLQNKGAQLSIWSHPLPKLPSDGSFKRRASAAWPATCRTLPRSDESFISIGGARLAALARLCICSTGERSLNKYPLSQNTVPFVREAL
jgi:hypothetical protein